jgi:hypothetical protein
LAEPKRSRSLPASLTRLGRSLAPLTPDQALRAALRVKPSDVAKLEVRERAMKKATGKKRRR